jgi:hypothetical protein
LAATPPRDRTAVIAALLGGWALLSMGVYPNERLGVNLFGVYLVAAGAALVVASARWREPALAPAGERSWA